MTDDLVAWLTGVLDGLWRDADGARRELVLVGRRQELERQGLDRREHRRAELALVVNDNWRDDDPKPHNGMCWNAFDIDHQQRHNPWTVLARVEAERSLLDLYRTGHPRVSLDIVMWIAYGHRYDAEGFDPAWAPDGVEVGA